MQVEFPNAIPLTPEDEAHLQKLQALIEKTIADGVLTAEEYTLIHDAIAANKKLLPEEVALVKTLVHDKLATSELITDWFERLS